MFKGNRSINLGAPNGVPKFNIGIYRKNYIFSFSFESVGPISTKLARNHHWGIGIQVCSNGAPGPQGSGLRGPKRAKCTISLKIFLSEGRAQNDLMLYMEHHRDLENQVCSREISLLT